MVNSKYYTPTIDAFYVGFEFEWYDEDDKTWNRTIIKTQSELYNWTAYDDINKRVKYLDKEDIESLGFIFIKNNSTVTEDNLEHFSFVYQKDDNLYGKIIIDYCNWFVYSTENKEDIKEYRLVRISKGDRMVFSGNIKNKSELVKVLKMLRIND